MSYEHDSSDVWHPTDNRLINPSLGGCNLPVLPPRAKSPTLPHRPHFPQGIIRSWVMLSKGWRGCLGAVRGHWGSLRGVRGKGRAFSGDARGVWELLRCSDFMIKRPTVKPTVVMKTAHFRNVPLKGQSRENKRGL